MIEQPDPRLKLRLVASDAAVLTVLWTLVLWLGPHSMSRSKLRSLGLVALIVVVACLAIRQAGLLLYRRCAVRHVEMGLIVRVTLFTVAFMLLFDRVLLTDTSVRFYVKEAIIGGTAMFVLLTAERSVWRAVLRASRQAGFRERRVIVIGSNSDAKRLVDLFRAHPEHGLRVVGVAGSKEDAERNALGHLWMGTAHEVERIIADQGVSGVVLAASPMEHPYVDDLMRRLLDAGIHVHLSTGLAGLDISRFRHLPVAREPMLYVENRQLRWSDQLAKRALDLAGSTFFLVVFAPVLLAIALAVKLGDCGPVFFRQERGGRGGRTFKVIKFRTMRVNAHAELAELAKFNEREGALFKMEHDPRVTRVGKFLRLSSLDELPQLFNVFLGQMSLVGPRPALPDEIAAFDEQLRTRDLVRPGITGLWQVEARDSPSADAYKRLDMFYLGNWSLMGDIAILLDTLEHLLGRVYRAVRRPPELPAVVEIVAPPTDPAGPAVKSA